MLHIVILSIAIGGAALGGLAICCFIINSRNEENLKELRKTAIKRKEQEYAHFSR